MANTTVKSVIDNAKLILQETTSDGIRWSNLELLGWLNEAYQKIISFKPNANPINTTMTCVADTKQSLPSDGVYLLDVVRNMASASNKSAITHTERHVLDATHRGWHNETQSDSIDYYIFDDQDQKNFYVYPPATALAEIEIIYAAVPEPHIIEDFNEGSKAISLDDRYSPALTDYILTRAYAKDAEFAGNDNRMKYHENSFMTAMGIKAKAESSSSPNNPTNKK